MLCLFNLLLHGGYSPVAPGVLQLRRRRSGAGEDFQTGEYGDNRFGGHGGEAVPGRSQIEDRDSCHLVHCIQEESFGVQSSFGGKNIFCLKNYSRLSIIIDSHLNYFFLSFNQIINFEDNIIKSQSKYNIKKTVKKHSRI